MEQPQFDVVIVGAGIVGLATGLALVRRSPELRLCILEKEARVAAHQTGHNSGVLHAGLYYKPGSLKARLCGEGKQRMVEFCQEHKVPYDMCGKVVIATDQQELARLDEIYNKALANGVPGVRKISRSELREIEPNAAGLAAVYSPQTGIVDYKAVAEVMARLLRAGGAQVQTEDGVVGIHSDGTGLRIQTRTREVRTRHLINCAGLHADVVAKMAGAEPGLRIVPFRGEYSFLRPERQDLVKALIYPVPDPALPFLGVHFTKTMDGRMEMGPNAVLAFAREGYTRWGVKPNEFWSTISYGGFWRLARTYWQTGIYEFYRSFSKAALVASLQRLVPAIQTDDVVEGGAGVRAQAIAPEGHLVYDFHVVRHGPGLHVLNAPSPAATASLAIGEHIANLSAEHFDLGLTGD